MRQDYFYLVDYVKFKALRLTTIPPGDFETLSSEAQGVGKSTGYVTDWMTTCVTQLGVNPQRFTTEERSVAELAYANYLQNNAKADDWFNLHVIMVACTYVCPRSDPESAATISLTLRVRDGPS
ncbi:MAG: hypothetical protein M1812_001503 [Candelaria pacifica]|nr:MAG: hypothetical protein M1812_001503 [Candelaria pacifica]